MTGAARRIDVLHLGGPVLNRGPQFHKYKVVRRTTLTHLQSQALLRDLLDARTYDRNTFSCDCFPEYGIIIHSQQSDIEFLIDRARVVDVTSGTTSWEQSWRRGAFKRIARLAE